MNGIKVRVWQKPIYVGFVCPHCGEKTVEEFAYFCDDKVGEVCNWIGSFIRCHSCKGEMQIDEIKWIRQENQMSKCNICGKKALEITEICQECLQRAEVAPQTIQKLRQVSDVLRISAGTDANVKECMESILKIAEDLERGK